MWSEKLGNSLLVEHETRIAVMTELEIMLLKCPCLMPAKSLRTVGNFFRICSAFEQNKIEYPKLKKIALFIIQITFQTMSKSRGLSYRMFPVSYSTIYPIPIPEFSLILEVHTECSCKLPSENCCNQHFTSSCY
jgi:hypothetical protein